MIQQVCVGGFIQNKKGEFLIVKRSDSDEFLPGLWELPGGGIEDGEKPQEGLLREIREEVGLDVVVKKPLSVSTYAMETGNESVYRVEITFQCLLTKEQQIKLSFEHSAHQWIIPDMIPHITFSEYMQQVITDCLHTI